MELVNCINFLLSASQHTVFQYFSEQLSPHSITPSQYGVLNCLWKHGELTPKQIGEMLCLEASSVSSVLDRMQKAALIDRNIDPDNRRTIIVTATGKGKELQAPVERIVDDLNETVLEPFTEEERLQLTRMLLVIVQRKLKKGSGE